MSQLFIGKRTNSKHVLSFLKDRLANPIQIGEATVFCFTNHEIDMPSLESLLEGERGWFVLPFNLAGAWAWMVELLPEEFRNGRVGLLRYRTQQEEFLIVDNPLDELAGIKRIFACEELAAVSAPHFALKEEGVFAYASR